MQETIAPPGRRRAALYLMAAVALSFAAYSSSVHGEFVFDDIPTLVANDCHRGLARIPSLFDPRNTTICSLRPVRFASFAIDHALWGDHVAGYHATNILLHGLVGWLGVLLLLRLGVSRRAALLSGVFFLIHPITTEAVAYISGRRDLLMALFCLLTVHAYFWYQDRGGWHRIGLTALCLIAALLSHESAAALPAALVVLELCRGGNTGANRLGRLFAPRRAMPLALLIGLVAVFAVWTLQRHDLSERNELWGPNLGAHVATVLRVHAHYLRLLVWPDPLIADYSPEGFRISRSLLDPGALWALALLAAVILLAWKLRSRWPLVSAAIVCHFVLLLPTSQIVIHHELLAEHRLYLSSLCFAGLLGAGGDALLRKLSTLKARTRLVLVGWVPILTLAALYLGRTNLRNLDWRSPLSLWSVTVRQVPRCARARSNLGAALAQHRRFGAARAELEIALHIRPDLCDARLNLGQLMLDTGRPDEGLDQLQQAVACSPKPSFLEKLGFAALAHGRLALAGRSFRRGLSQRPASAELHYGLGTVLHRTGKLSDALAQYDEAARTRPDWPRLLYRTALVLAESCKVQAAEATSRRFLKIWPKGSAEEQRLVHALRQAKARCSPEET